MKIKLIALFLIATLTFALAAGCSAKTENDASANKSANASTPASATESASESEENAAADPLGFLSDGQIRVDFKLFSHDSLDGLTVKIDGETVVYKTAKTYAGSKTFTLEGTISFPLTAHYIISDGNALTSTGSTTANSSEDLSRLGTVLSAYAGKLNESMKRMYVLLTDDKDATWNAAL